MTSSPLSARVTIPYVQGQSEAIRRVLQGLYIQTSFAPATSLRRILSHPKDPVPSSNKSGVVYQIPCADCNKSYIGQTGRNLSQRIKEHQKAVATFNTDTSALAEHVLSKDHHIDWEKTSVIDQHPFTQTRCLVESWYINHIPNTLNRERGPLPEIYQSLKKTTSTITSHTHHEAVNHSQAGTESRPRDNYT